MPRESNPALVARFRELLTAGFYVIDEKGRRHNAGDPDMKQALADTKAWRADVWRAFREIDDRLCPKPPGAGEEPNPEVLNAEDEHSALDDSGSIPSS